jgi:hypothetical protein
MEILVTESARGAATSAAGRLVAAGHRVHRCRVPGAATFPCAGVTGACPIETAPIDVVLTVRDQVRTTPAPTEDGVTCALRRHVPVAVTGRSVLNPFEVLGATVIDEDDVVGGCERVAAARRVAHEAVADEVVRATLAVAGCPTGPATVVVRRASARLRVQVTVPDGVPKRVRDVVAVRVAGRLRAFDPDAAGIDIGVGTGTVPADTTVR